METVYYQGDKYSFTDFVTKFSNSRFANAAKLAILLELYLGGQQSFEFRSSGSTGEPKILHFSLDKIFASAQATISATDIRENEAIAIALSLDTVGAKMQVFRALKAKADLMLFEPSSAILGNVYPGFQHISIAPMQMDGLLNYCRFLPASSKLNVLIGGADLTEVHYQQIEQFSKNVQIWHTYGMTETLSHVALRSVWPVPEKEFHTLPNVEITTDDESCLLIKSFITDNQWLKTNDMVELIEKTAFRFLGRADLTVNSGGIKLSISKLESFIQAQNILISAAEWCLLGVEDTALGEKLCLVCTETIDSETLLQLNAAIEQEFDKYHKIRSAYRVQVIPRTASLKVDRKLLSVALLNGSIGATQLL